MPELVRPGESGALVEGESVDELCHAILSVLGDDEVYRRCQEGRAEAAEYFTWSRAADDVLSAMSPSLERR